MTARNFPETTRPIIFPAIDLRGGRCVRLVQGARNAEIHYGDDPWPRRSGGSARARSAST
jgi:phosphoribosylformimino-5-aminoimidazole carboxamide ribonucleotide (ProFAR) isomerase